MMHKINEDAIFFISSGITVQKKWHNPLSEYNIYLNYGLLGLASIVKEEGYNVKFIQGNIHSPKKAITNIIRECINEPKHPIFVSIPSFFAIEWAKQFCYHIKTIFPKAKIVAGGKWVIGNNPNWLYKKIPEIDICVGGNAEKKILSLIQDYNNYNKYFINCNENLTQYPPLNYSLINNLTPPSIEISRGCNHNCMFCEEKNISPLRIKNPEIVIKEINSIVSLYNNKECNIYFESSHFNPEISWIKRFNFLYKKREIHSKWRVETRVDTLNYYKIKLLSEAGLRVIDLGLESASPRQLINMGKTNNPDSYLKKAKETIIACHENGIWVKLNVLLYPGENKHTINQTYNWLIKLKKYIKGISIYPLILYGPKMKNSYYFKEIEELGASCYNNTLENFGYQYLNLSYEIDYMTSIKISNRISKSIMSTVDYYDLKSFSYFPRDFTFHKFLRIIEKYPKEKFPFYYDNKASINF